MHKDYRVSSPLQIIKYANRIEFRNAGYSLKPLDQLGLPGSIQRNEVLSKVFHNIHYAEAKGTGIGVMREEMRKMNLSVPLIESDRGANLFVLTLLPHHLFNKNDIECLGHFSSYNLTDDDARTLITIREMGAITNADYRTINGVDTLVASSRLRRLRDLGLLVQKGNGNATYYIPSKLLLTPFPDEETSHINEASGEVDTHTSPISEEAATPINKESEEIPLSIDLLMAMLPNDLQIEIAKIGKKTPTYIIRDTIRKLCSIRPFKPAEIGILLKRTRKHVSDRHLGPMVESGELEMEFPHHPTHPLQAYKTKKII